MRVVTGTDSQATLKFLDGQTIHLDPESVFWIRTTATKDKPVDNRSTTELLGWECVSSLEPCPRKARRHRYALPHRNCGTRIHGQPGQRSCTDVISGRGHGPPVLRQCQPDGNRPIRSSRLTVDKAGNPPTVGQHPPHGLDCFHPPPPPPDRWNPSRHQRHRKSSGHRSWHLQHSGGGDGGGSGGRRGRLDPSCQLQDDPDASP